VYVQRGDIGGADQVLSVAAKDRVFAT